MKNMRGNSLKGFAINWRDIYVPGGGDFALYQRMLIFLS
jgi:hypothetical protein